MKMKVKKSALLAGSILAFMDGIRQEKHGTPKMSHVIVSLGKDGVLKGTRVKKSHVKAFNANCQSNHVKAALNQHPNIDQKLDKLCTLFTQCWFTHKDMENLDATIHKRMQDAIMHQYSEGLHAVWCEVEFEQEWDGVMESARVMEQ